MNQHVSCCHNKKLLSTHFDMDVLALQGNPHTAQNVKEYVGGITGL
jgi:hypothetical protein